MTAAPASTASPVMVPSLWAVTGFSIFMASSTTTRSPADDLLTLFDGDLDDGALHGCGHRVTGGRRHRRARHACAALGFLRMAPGWRGAAAVADREVTGQRHLEATAADLDDDLLPRLGLFLVDARRRR